MAWDYLKENVSETLIRRLGLDDGAVFRVVATLLAFFAVCIPLFLMMVRWTLFIETTRLPFTHTVLLGWSEVVWLA